MRTYFRTLRMTADSHLSRAAGQSWICFDSQRSDRGQFSHFTASPLNRLYVTSQSLGRT